MLLLSLSHRIWPTLQILGALQLRLEVTRIVITHGYLFYFLFFCFLEEMCGVSGFTQHESSDQIQIFFPLKWHGLNLQHRYLSRVKVHEIRYCCWFWPPSYIATNSCCFCLIHFRMQTIFYASLKMHWKPSIMTYVGDQLRICAQMTTGANVVEAVVLFPMESSYVEQNDRVGDIFF